MEHKAGQTQPVQSRLPRRWGWRFQNVSCCFKPGGPRCLGCVSQHESHLQPHKDACSLPEIKHRHMVQTSETVGPRPKNLVTKDGYGSPGEMGASLGSPKLVKRNMNWKHGDSLCRLSPAISSTAQRGQLLPWFGPKSRPWEKDLGLCTLSGRWL